MTESSPADFYITTGTMSPDAESYIVREADEELYRSVSSGELCYVLTTRQMGKSSLMARTAKRLDAAGIRSALITIETTRETVKNPSADKFLYGLAHQIHRALSIPVSLRDWWNARDRLSSTQRFSDYLTELVIEQVAEPVVVSIDEIDSTIGLPFSDDFFATIRACYNARALRPELRRLTFVLLGTATPGQLIANPDRTPFNVGKGIELTDFTEREAEPLSRAFPGTTQERGVLLARVLHWTAGHPYLTQKVCQAVSRAAPEALSDRERRPLPGVVDEEVARLFFSTSASREEANLKFVDDRLKARLKGRRAMLRTYERVLKGRVVVDQPTSSSHASLKLAGVVRTNSRGELEVRNRIYRRVFGQEWVRRERPWAFATRAGAVAVRVSAATHLFDVVNGIGIAFIAAGFAWTTFGLAFDRTLYDAHMRLTAPGQPPPEIVIVDIDDDSVRELVPFVGKWPWPRLVHARLLDYLTRGRPAVVAYDVQFAEHDYQRKIDIGGVRMTGAESDQAFVESVAKAGNVVLATGTWPAPADTQSATELLPGGNYRLALPFPTRLSVMPPFPSLAAAARSLGHKVVNVQADDVVRAAPPFVRSGGRLVPSLGLAAGLAFSNVNPTAVRGSRSSLDLEGMHLPLIESYNPEADPDQTTSLQSLIPFRGPMLRSTGLPLYRTYSAADLLLSEEQIAEGKLPRVDPGTFRDAIVFVGISAAGVSDRLATPFGSTSQATGTFVHATIADQVISRRAITQASWVSIMTLTMVLCALLSAITLSRSFAVGMAWTVCVLVGGGAISLVAFDRGLWLPMAMPLIGTLLAGGGGACSMLFQRSLAARRIRSVFGRRVSEDVFSRIMEAPDAMTVTSDTRMMTVLFVAVRGASTDVEEQDAKAFIAGLGECMSHINRTILSNNGMLNRAAGDSVGALFGAPLKDDEHADHAVATAVRILREIVALNQKWQSDALPTFEIEIGVNSGHMTVGIIDGAYTVIGDAVEMGARLQSLNREYGTRVIIGATTARLLREKHTLRLLGTVTVKGERMPSEIFEVVDVSQPA